MISADYVIDEGRDWKITIPKRRVASNSVLIDSKGGENSTELFTILQKVVRLWESQGISNYLVYKSSREANWEMVPYAGTSASTRESSLSFGGW